MDVAVDKQDRLKAADDPVEGDESDVGGVLGLGDTERWGVRDEHVKLAVGANPLQPDPKLQAEDAPPHLRL
jgi:hypothetical protein